MYQVSDEANELVEKMIRLALDIGNRTKDEDCVLGERNGPRRFTAEGMARLAGVARSLEDAACRFAARIDGALKGDSDRG